VWIHTSGRRQAWYKARRARSKKGAGVSVPVSVSMSVSVSVHWSGQVVSSDNVVDLKST